MFKLWSQLNPKANSELKPDFGLREWADLNGDEKHSIWKHLECDFFDKDIKVKRDFMGYKEGYYYYFSGFSDAEKGAKKKRVYRTIIRMNDMYKAKNYTPNYLESRSFNSACADFYNLFSEGSENAFFELISIYAEIIIAERRDEKLIRKEGGTNAQYNKQLETWRWEDFDEFANRLNEILGHFCLNMQLTRLGFTPRQEGKIDEEIYKPALKKLSNKKWKDVNRDLADAFVDYRKDDFSGSITHVLSAIQAFLQVSLYGKIGKGNISSLIKDAKKKKVIPDDDFSTLFFEKMESYMAQTRQDKGDPHPKKEYATEKNARLVLNLAMVFFEHCL
jgi:hypothetical protein